MKLFERLRQAGHGRMVMNAVMMIGTTVITAGLGFVYWWVAARSYAPGAVGVASALVSAMGLLSTLGMFGLGTLLIGELARRPQERDALITAGLIGSGAVSGLFGALFGLIAPRLSAEFAPLASPGGLALFAAGVALSTVTLVADQAMIGLLRGGVQLWRNGVFAVAKLVALAAAASWIGGESSLGIYATWALGNLLSLAVLAAAGWRMGLRLRLGRSDWAALRELPRAAMGHHGLNLALQLPGLALPVVVTGLLSASLNASFYMAWLLLHLVFAVPYTLTTVLYAAGAAERDQLRQKLRLTLGLALAAATLSNLILWPAAELLMGVFGASYAAEAAWPLRIMALGVYPLIIKDHYVAIRRIREEIPHAAGSALIGSALELGLASAGAALGGLEGVALGFVAALALEAAWMAGTVRRAVIGPSPAAPPLLAEQS